MNNIISFQMRRESRHWDAQADEAARWLYQYRQEWQCGKIDTKEYLFRVANIGSQLDRLKPFLLK